MIALCRGPNLFYNTTTTTVYCSFTFFQYDVVYNVVYHIAILFTILWCRLPYHICISYSPQAVVVLVNFQQILGEQCSTSVEHDWAMYIRRTVDILGKNIIIVELLCKPSRLSISSASGGTCSVCTRSFDWTQMVELCCPLCSCMNGSWCLSVDFLAPTLAVLHSHLLKHWCLSIASLSTRLPTQRERGSLVQFHTHTHYGLQNAW